MKDENINKINDVEHNPLLVKLADDTANVANLIDQSVNHAMLIFGVEYVDQNPAEEVFIKTFISASGDISILEEGLYAEFLYQVNNGNRDLLNMFRRVIRAVEEEIGLEPDEQLEDDKNINNYLH